MIKDLTKKKTHLVEEQKQWEEEKPLIIAEQDLKQDKKDTKNRKKEQKKALSTTKRLMIFLFVSCSIIQIFTLVVTVISMTAGIYDFTALQMLITAVVGEVVAFAVYSLKSLKENTKGGIVYETAMWEKETQYEENDDQEVQG